jgi:HEPN domain-containing protein
MTGGLEWLRWLRDAEQCLAEARGGLASGHPRSACVMGQLAVELAAKAAIAAFAEPQWTHDPAGQLRAVLCGRADAELESQFGPDCRGALEQLAADAHEAAVWHGWATYGRRLADRTWVAAADVCTPEAAGELVERAERCVAAAGRLRSGAGRA